MSKVDPIFTNNYAVHHRPDFVIKQFVYNHVDYEEDAFEFVNYNIKTKDNLTQYQHKYGEFYKKELKIWEESKCLEDLMVVRNFQHQTTKHAKLSIL